MKRTKHQRNELMEMIAHLCVGLSIFMKGIDKFEHHHTLIGLMLVLAGLMVLAFSIYHKKIESTLGKIKYYIFGIESIVMALIGIRITRMDRICCIMHIIWCQSCF